MTFEPYTGRFKPHWCQHVDLIGIKELSSWFKFQEDKLLENLKREDNVKHSLKEITKIQSDVDEFYKWKNEFIRLGLLDKKGGV